MAGNLERVHKLMYEQALQLLEKENDTASQSPDGSVRYFSIIEVLSTLTLTSHPANRELYDCKKFADEAVRICREIGRRYLMPGAEHDDLAEIDKLAQEALNDVAKGEVDLVSQGKEVFPPFVPEMDLKERTASGALHIYNPKQLEGSCYSTTTMSYVEVLEEEEMENAWMESQMKRRPVHEELQWQSGNGGSSD